MHFLSRQMNLVMDIFRRIDIKEVAPLARGKYEALISAQLLTECMPV